VTTGGYSSVVEFLSSGDQAYMHCRVCHASGNYDGCIPVAVVLLSLRHG
jgi:hypothetical protein